MVLPSLGTSAMLDGCFFGCTSWNACIPQKATTNSGDSKAVLFCIWVREDSDMLHCRHISDPNQTIQAFPPAVRQCSHFPLGIQMPQ